MSDEQRFAIHDKWISAARNFLARAPDDEGVRILEFFTTNAVIAAPTSEGIATLERTRTPQWFVLLHLLADDLEKVPALSSSLYAGSAAQFTPTTRLMLLKESEKYTDAYKAVLLLHEGRHALRTLVDNFYPDGPLAVAREERDTHDFQNRLVTKYGGAPYKTILEREIRRRLKKTSRLNYRPGHDFFSYPVEEGGMDGIFGVAPSEVERQARCVHLEMHVSFTIIARYFKGNITEQQTRCYLWYLEHHQKNL